MLVDSWWSIIAGAGEEIVRLQWVRESTEWKCVSSSCALLLSSAPCRLQAPDSSSSRIFNKHSHQGVRSQCFLYSQQNLSLAGNRTHHCGRSVCLGEGLLMPALLLTSQHALHSVSEGPDLETHRTDSQISAISARFGSLLPLHQLSLSSHHNWLIDWLINMQSAKYCG